MVSANEVAAALGEVLERDVTARPLARDLWAPTLERIGFPPGRSWAFEEIYDGVNAHWIGFGVAGAERVEGTTNARQVFAANFAIAHGADADGVFDNEKEPL